MDLFKTDPSISNKISPTAKISVIPFQPELFCVRPSNMSELNLRFPTHMSWVTVVQVLGWSVHHIQNKVVTIDGTKYSSVLCIKLQVKGWVFLVVIENDEHDELLTSTRENVFINTKSKKSTTSREKKEVENMKSVAEMNESPGDRIKKMMTNEPEIGTQDYASHLTNIAIWKDGLADNYVYLTGDFEEAKSIYSVYSIFGLDNLHLIPHPPEMDIFFDASNWIDNYSENRFRFPSEYSIQVIPNEKMSSFWLQPLPSHEMSEPPEFESHYNELMKLKKTNKLAVSDVCLRRIAQFRCRNSNKSKSSFVMESDLDKLYRITTARLTNIRKGRDESLVSRARVSIDSLKAILFAIDELYKTTDTPGVDMPRSMMQVICDMRNKEETATIQLPEVNMYNVSEESVTLQQLFTLCTRVGADQNVPMLYNCILGGVNAAQRGNKCHTIVQGEASCGKSTIYKKFCKFMPDHTYQYVTDVSNQAFSGYGEDSSASHKFFMMGEPPRDLLGLGNGGSKSDGATSVNAKSKGGSQFRDILQDGFITYIQLRLDSGRQAFSVRCNVDLTFSIAANNVAEELRKDTPLRSRWHITYAKSCPLLESSGHVVTDNFTNQFEEIVSENADVKDGEESRTRAEADLKEILLQSWAVQILEKIGVTCVDMHLATALLDLFIQNLPSYGFSSDDDIIRRFESRVLSHAQTMTVIHAVMCHLSVDKSAYDVMDGESMEEAHDRLMDIGNEFMVNQTDENAARWFEALERMQDDSLYVNHRTKGGSFLSLLHRVRGRLVCTQSIFLHSLSLHLNELIETSGQYEMDELVHALNKIKKSSSHPWKVAREGDGANAQVAKTLLLRKPKQEDSAFDTKGKDEDKISSGKFWIPFSNMLQKQNLRMNEQTLKRLCGIVKDNQEGSYDWKTGTIEFSNEFLKREHPTPHSLMEKFCLTLCHAHQKPISILMPHKILGWKEALCSRINLGTGQHILSIRNPSFRQGYRKQDFPLHYEKQYENGIRKPLYSVKWASYPYNPHILFDFDLDERVVSDYLFLVGLPSKRAPSFMSSGDPSFISANAPRLYWPDERIENVIDISKWSRETAYPDYTITENDPSCVLVTPYSEVDLQAPSSVVSMFCKLLSDGKRNPFNLENGTRLTMNENRAHLHSLLLIKPITVAVTHRKLLVTLQSIISDLMRIQKKDELLNAIALIVSNGDLCLLPTKTIESLTNLSEIVMLPPTIDEESKGIKRKREKERESALSPTILTFQHEDKLIKLKGDLPLQKSKRVKFQ